ncbi:MAG TPA: hypothetical protein VFT64_08565 [Rickettsiales bacterium]|nr:hypothetical protein [Rickettsiales bacterium]
MEHTNWWRQLLAVFASALLVVGAIFGGVILDSNLHSDNGTVIVLPDPGPQIVTVDNTPYTFVQGGNAYFDANGPVVDVYFTTYVGNVAYNGRIFAKFAPNKHGRGSHPEIIVTGNTSNLVETWSDNNGLPVLDIHYVHPGSLYDTGFVVEFNAQYRYDLGGLYAYPEFGSYDWSSMSGCEVAGNTHHFFADGGDGLTWYGFNALTQMATVDAWYGASSPEVSVNGGIVRLADLGFRAGQPFAEVRYGDRKWFNAGFNSRGPVMVGAPHKDIATC